MTISDQVLELVARRSGMSEREIAEHLFGAKAAQQRVNGVCRLLVAEGRLQRHGRGGPGDPFTYSR